ncbi:VOC family protein [Roseovarius sp. S4756]|uniref:VOC family protein n=1 Tax=Roseovarius maritimus TaxID=3342637 RepID=UPI00372BEE43
MLDHLVINTLFGMEAAAAQFNQLGFQLTPRGHHSLGSINHLMVDPASYLELVGVPASGTQRQEVLDSPKGLSGLVFRTDDAEATYAHLIAVGFAPQEPILLERPVNIGGTSRKAQFRNVRMTAAEFPAGRVYFCQHLTPDLVWRDDWMAHPNGFHDIGAITIADPDPEAEAARYAALTGGRADGVSVTAEGLALTLCEGATPAFASAELLFDDVDDIAARAAQMEGAEWRWTGAGTGVLTIPALAVTLECCSATH